ncbi:MAG: carbonic anhydrase [Deltaproteobacteria bacterium]|nr:carbonic anhydrase [Deltaproteobacteria bacterium]
MTRWKMAFGLVTVAALAVGCGKSEPLKGVVPEEALKRLAEGNQRYVAAKASHPDQTPERRTQVAGGQSPFAIVLGCADSRVPPEVLFDQGLGDLFTVRVAGNVLDDAGLGSLEYAADHLGVHLLVVLGHERCGAVDAAVKGGEAEGRVKYLVKALKPAVSAAKGLPGDVLDNAVRANVALVVKQLKTSKPVLAELVEDGKLAVVGARYDLDTGIVEILKP